MLSKLLRRHPPKPAGVINLDEFSATVTFSSRRKTLTIKVAEGKVRVQASSFATEAEIIRFLKEKRHWVAEKIAHQTAQIEARQRHWHSGAELPLLGRPIYLQVEPAARGPVTLVNDQLLVRARSAATGDAVERNVQAQVQRWYKATAAADIAERLIHWQKVTGITANGFNVKTYKARWGSCNHRAELSFNWKLIMAPPAVIDYVVVHELCHIVHFNHSPAYWRLVSRYQPNFKIHKQWLRDNGLTLEL